MSIRNAGSQARGQPNARPASAKPGFGQKKAVQIQPASSIAPALTKLSDSKLLQFERQGFLITKQLVPEKWVLEARDAVQQVIQERRLEALKHRVRVLCPNVKDLDSIQSPEQALQLIQQQGDSDLGFLQFFNLHRTKVPVAWLTQLSQLTKTAAQLLGVKRLRLYQDCVFLKEPGYAETNWHSDLRMAPLDTNAFITAWIPLRPILGGEDDSGLVFAAGSHRDFALPFWHDTLGRDLGDRGYEIADTGPMSLGDVSWHHGWTLHGAAPQPPGTQQRLALAISFFEDGAKLLARTSDPSVYKHMLHDEDAESYGSWLCDLKDGAVAKHQLLNVVLPSIVSTVRLPRRFKMT